MDQELQAKQAELEKALKTQAALKAELSYLESVEEEIVQQSNEDQIATIRKTLK